MLTNNRRNAMALLHSVRPEDLVLCREVESHCHAAATTVQEYHDRIIRCAYNLKLNQAIGINVVYDSDAILSAGTVVGRIYAEQEAKKSDLSMLQEKYEAGRREISGDRPLSPLW